MLSSLEKLRNKFTDEEIVDQTITRFWKDSDKVVQIRNTLSENKPTIINNRKRTFFNRWVTSNLKARTKRPTPTPTNISTTPSSTPLLPTNNNFKWASIVDYLWTIWINSSFANRWKIAQDLWIQNYVWSAEQNTQILNKLRSQNPVPITKEEITQSRNDSINSLIDQWHSNSKTIVDILNNDESWNKVWDISIKEVENILNGKQSGYTWPSIEKYLISVWKDSSFSARKKIANQLWIQNYRWTAEQNTQILNTLRNNIPNQSEEEKVSNNVWVNTQTNLDNLKTLRENFSDEEIINKAREKYWEWSDKFQRIEELLRWNPIWDLLIDNFDSSNPNSNLSKDELIKDFWNLSNIDNNKINVLDRIRNQDISRFTEDFNRSIAVLNKNNASLLSLYWLNADWSVDLTNKDWFAFQFKKNQEEYERTKKASLKDFTSIRLNQVQWELRAALRRRWVDVANIPEEQLLRLSGAIWQQAYVDIYNAKEKANDELLANSNLMMQRLQWLREKWLISRNELELNSEKIRAAFESNVAAINKDFANTVYWLWDASEVKSKNDKKDVINTVTSLWANLWLSWTTLWVLKSFIENSTDSISAYENILDALNNTNSQLYREVNDVEKASKAAAEFKAQLDLLKINKSNSSWSGSNSTKPKKPTKISSTARNKLFAIWINVDTYDELVQFYNDPELRPKIQWALNNADLQLMVNTLNTAIKQ